MSWKAAQEEWELFLEQVVEVRHSLNCSHSNAWFRGHSNSKYELLPSLFRADCKPPVPKSDLEKIDSKIKTYRKKLDELLRNKSITRKDLYIAFNDMNNKDYEQLNENNLENSSKELECIQKNIFTIKQSLNDYQQEKKDLTLLCLGEREAFIEYSFRSGRNYHSSWETLAEMQHHGVPTRLLDWTEVLAIGLYFALVKYTEKINKFWLTSQKNQNKDEKYKLLFPPEDLIFDIPEPSLWILNPYKASKEATGKLRLWDLTLEKDFDYFEKFISSNTWHFDKPIPMYSPWRNTRIAAQQGMFTVFGYDKRFLNEQFPKNVVREVKIKPLAAVYGAKLLKDLFGIDHYMLFRDLDTLAKKVKSEFLS